MRNKILVSLLLGSFFWLQAQYVQPESGPVFVEDEVPRVDLFLPQSDLDKIFEDVESDEEFAATFIFTSSELIDTLEEVGVRLRGNTSRHSAKKSIKVSFNGFRPGRKFKGLEKLNLNGEHNDPSIIRSKLCWDLCHQLGIPASRSNHVALYINTQYMGLYINVEQVDEEFIQKRFQGENGNLYKCLWPADLAFKGTDPNVYKEVFFGRRAYELKTNKDRDNYTDLAEFIKVLNNYKGEMLQCEIEKLFDVDTYLKTIVMDVLTSNWDGPIVNKNNFFLYTDSHTGRITYIPFDLDNTLGIDWFGVNWAETDIYNWSSYSGEERPIYDQILSIPEYRDRYSFYLRETMEKYFNVLELFPYLESKRNLIEDFRLNDPLAGRDYGWTYNDFLASYDEPLGGHVKNGLVDYIDLRVSSALAQVENNDILPYLRLDYEIATDEVVFSGHAQDDGEITELQLNYKIDDGPWETASVELDTDNSFGFVLPYSSTGTLDYYFDLTDDANQGSSYPKCRNGQLQLGFTEVSNIVINEFIASNSSTSQDEGGDYDDWIELYNAGNSPVPLNNFFLTDDPDNVTKWRLPNILLNPRQYLIVWADEDGHQGDRHANFKLSKAGEFVGLYDGPENNFAPIDTITFPEQETDRSYARRPNAVGPFEITEEVTFRGNNDMFSSVEESSQNQINIYPNPVQDLLHLGNDQKLYSIKCYNSSGILMLTKNLANQIDVSEYPVGIYLVKIEGLGSWRFIKVD